MLTPDVALPGFADLGLRPEIIQAIDEAGYTVPTPIQAQAIPEVLRRRDLIGIAQTGTGKTASFVLPMLDILASGRSRARMPRSLILSPTRELATQTARNFETYGKHLSLTMALLIGGVGMGDQEKTLEKGVDVLIATPGRLLDWFERGRVMLNGIDIVVIDEADRMLDMGFMPDVERIVSLLIKRQQTLLFSATMLPEVRRLADRFLKEPIVIQVAAKATSAALVEDVLVPVTRDDKRETLVTLIRREAVRKAIVFCNRKRDIGGVMRHLQRAGLHARDLHGDLDQHHRQATLDQFTRGEIDFLVATDVAARGLDISEMPVVINHDVPMNPEDYIHRIGRTGRAGRKGRAFTLVSPADARFLGNIEKLMGRSITRLELNGASSPAPEATDGPAEEQAPRHAAGASERPPRREPGERRRRLPRPPRDAAPVAETAPVVAAVGAPTGEPAPSSPSAAPSADKAPAHRPPRRREREPERRHEREPEGPVVGMGDHVPRFLLQAIPPKLVARAKAE